MSNNPFIDTDTARSLQKTVISVSEVPRLLHLARSSAEEGQSNTPYSMGTAISRETGLPSCYVNPLT